MGAAVRRREVLRRAGGYWLIDATKDAPAGELARLTDDALVNIASNLGIEVEPDEVAMPTILWFQAAGLVGDRCGWRSYRIGGVHDARTLAVVECDGDSASVVRRLVDFRNDEMRRR